MGLFRRSQEPEEEGKVEELRRRSDEVGLPPEARKVATQELDTLANVGPSSSEYTIGLTYLEYLLGMPWNTCTEDNLDIARAEAILNEDHHSLCNVKERVLEYLATKVLVARRKPRVLIVDDEAITRNNLSHVLGKDGYHVLTAGDGTEALDVLAGSEVDVIITDLKMPGVDGIGVLEAARKRQPGARVIVITGYATVPSAVETMGKGAYWYLPKPFKLEEVRSVVTRALEEKPLVVPTRGSVLCFSGPPGTGKTSMGLSIAKALGRKFIRLSLAGVRDEADIRGHRRTYVGAKPGRIIEAIRRAGSANPVIMMDEVDKIGQSAKGDPASALLEVLDPEQNEAFVDHYLDVPFDVSRAIFILTANFIDDIPAPLRDRMEVIHFPGYTEEEKVTIALKFLVPKQIGEKGLRDRPPAFTREAVERIIREYTREAGIRGLERQIATVCRKLAKELIQEGAGKEPTRVTPESVQRYLGPKRFRFEVVEEHDTIGVATGLVLSESGADIIFVEAAQMKGGKQLVITGSLGDVMRESALAALSYVRSHAASFGIGEDFFEHHDIHIHVPLGAVQKDGPSAGLTIVVALLSLLKKLPVRRDVATTGEITLTGRVLPVGGLREKILAAARAGVKTVVIPWQNRSDMDDIPGNVKGAIEIMPVRTADEVVELVLRT
jgi:ATP-dependent Lon protease